MINIKTGNELTREGKIWGAILIIIFTLLPVVFIVAIWPDRLPAVGEHSGLIYQWRWFNVQLADHLPTTGPYMSLNSIIFLLVALAGFLGSMIHIATSFTNFIGAEQFKKSWIPWYFVKPFTATGVALILYFVLRAGLLNLGDSNQVNLYGLVTLSALAGLFTDKATIKLEEVFTVIFRPKDARPDKLEKDKVNVDMTGIAPRELVVNQDNQLLISGGDTGQQLLKLKINHVDIPDFTIRPNGISFSYLLPEEINGMQNIPLQIFDEKGTELFRKEIQFKK